MGASREGKTVPPAPTACQLAPNLVLRRELCQVNHKKLFQICRDERLAVRKSGWRKRALGSRAPMLLPQPENQRWSLDFELDALSDSRWFRIFTFVDAFTCKWLAARGG